VTEGWGDVGCRLYESCKVMIGVFERGWQKVIEKIVLQRVLVLLLLEKVEKGEVRGKIAKSHIGQSEGGWKVLPSSW